MWSDAFYYKNIEGYHLPFSFWNWKSSPLLLEPQGRDSFTQLDDGKTMLGGDLLRRNCLDTIIGRIGEIPYYEWPETKHLKHIHIRAVLNQQGMHNSLRLFTFNQIVDPHFKDVRFKGPRTV